MADISSIQIGVTNSGLESIAAMVATGTIFTISAFRLTDIRDEATFEAKKSYTSLDPDNWYMPYTAAEFTADHPLGTEDLSAFGLSDSDGFITVNSVELADVLTVEINCYIPPTAGLTFSANEIMIYTGAGSLADPYKTFAWGVFPEITKLEKYGINFRCLIQF